jgi:negative regulator of replication initiation
MSKNKKFQKKMNDEEASTSHEKLSPPDNFITIVRDFLKDLSVTFPEYIYLWASWTDPKLPESEIQRLYEYCTSIFPERFFDILYQNGDIFQQDSNINTFFLPNVDFKVLYNTVNVSENTKKALWKYLQLLLFTIVNSVKDKTNFGDTMNLFDGINENELQEKLNETFSSIGDFFKNMEKEHSQMNDEEGQEGQDDEEEQEEQEEQGQDGESKFEGFKFDRNSMPNAEELHGHLKGLFEGKIGTLAKELAEEISHDFQDILDDGEGDPTSTQDVLKKMLKNPKKIMDLMKTVSGKLDSKMKNGEISKDEIMKEASEWMSKMKDMGGTDQFNEIFKNITKNMGGLGKNMKFDTNAFNKMTKQQSMKERMRSRLEQRKQQAMNQMKQNELQNSVISSSNPNIIPSNEPNKFIFKMEDEGVQEKSYSKKEVEKSVDDVMESLGLIDEPTLTTKPKTNKKKKGKK